MEKRKLPHGSADERFSVLGLGLGGIQGSSEEEIEAVITKAIEQGINFFDLCAAHQKVYGPFGKAIRNHRSQVFFQLHFGAVYNKKGDYGWSRDLSRIQETFAWEMEQLQTDYVDFGFLHCVDEDDDVDALIAAVQKGIRMLRR